MGDIEMDNIDKRYLRLLGRYDDPITSDEDDAPSESLDMLESRLRQMQRRTALNREHSRAATRLQSRYRGNRIRTLKKRNRETLDRMRRNVEQMKRDPYMDEARSRFFAPESSIIHQNTRHGDITDLIVPYLAIEHRKRQLSRLIDEFKSIKKNSSVNFSFERFTNSIRMNFDDFIIKYLELPPDVKKIIIDLSISMNLDKSALELYDSSDDSEYDSDEEPIAFNIYLKELELSDTLYRLTQLIVDNLIESGNSELQAYRYMCYFVEFLIDNYY